MAKFLFASLWVVRGSAALIVLGLSACALAIYHPKGLTDAGSAAIFLLFPLLVGLGIIGSAGAYMIENSQRKRRGVAEFLCPTRAGPLEVKSYSECESAQKFIVVMGILCLFLFAVLAFFVTRKYL